MFLTKQINDLPKIMTSIEQIESHIFKKLEDLKACALDYYDSVLTSGDFPLDPLRKLEELRHLNEKEIRVVGSTYMDRLYEQSQQYTKEEHDIPTVLLAPTWGNYSILSKYGSEFISKLAETGYKIIIRPHPQSRTADKELLDRLQAEFPDFDNLEWNYDNDNFKVLSQADILISDYSGVMFDYSFIFNRPIIYTDATFTPDPYEAYWLNEEPWLIKVLPTMGQKLEYNEDSDLKQSIDNALQSKELEANRIIIRDEGWQYKGEAAKRTVDYMVGKYEEITRQWGED